MNDRIKAVRIGAGLSQVSFGSRIGVSLSGVQKLEYGRNTPSEQTIRAICREFAINRRWLETGDGDMHEESADIAREVRDLMRGESEFKQNIMVALACMPDSVWQLWEDKLNELKDN